MRFQILHESRGRVRLRAVQPSMSMEQADLLEAWLTALPGVEHVTVHERVCGVIIVYHSERQALYQSLAAFSYALAEEETHILSRNSRAINREYKEKLVFRVVRHYLKKLFLPMPVRQVITTCMAVPRIWKAGKVLLSGRLTVDVLDGVAIGVSLLTGDHSTAGSVRFLLSLGETLDEWTHKKSVDDLAKSMSLQVEQVWLRSEDGSQVLVPLDQVKAGDRIIVHTGHVLPMDGVLEEGDVMLNQASLTGESVPVAKHPGAAAAIAEKLRIDDYHAEVLPEDKAQYIKDEQARGRTVVMIGDGINDAPALSLADVGIAIGSGATIAREVADITIAAEDLRELVLLRRLSEKLMQRIARNYRFVMSFNGALILFGALGLLPPATSALLHNGSTLLLSMDCLTDLLPE